MILNLYIHIKTPHTPHTQYTLLYLIFLIISHSSLVKLKMYSPGH